MTTMELDAPSSGGPPAIKFDKPGAYVVCGIVDVKEYQQRDLATGDLKFWADGKPQMGKLVVGLVISHDGAYTTRDDTDVPVDPGMLVSFWCEKGKHYTWRDAVREHPGRKVLVGDVMKWSREADKPATKAGFNAQKVYRAALRSPEARDGDIVDRCAAARIAQANRPAVDEPQPGYSEAPF
jgi:hypothetical protein